MQNDLISRQAVIDIIHKEIEKTTSFAEHETQINIEMAVQELPCAYDVEKVIEQLEDRTDLAKNFFTTSKVIHINTVRKYIRNAGKE